MRTAVTFDEDTAQAVEHLRRERHVGVSAAVNELIRRGAMPAVSRDRFVQTTSQGGARVDMSDVAETLALLDGPGHG